MGHDYTSPQYSAQRFKEFLGSEWMFKEYGSAFLNARCGDNFVSFPFSQREFAVRFEPIEENEKLKAHLEVRVEGGWEDIKTETIKVIRNKKGKISDRTYVALFSNFVKTEIHNYIRTKR